MRITKEALLKNARDLTEKKLAPDRNVVAVFVVGSMLQEDPFIGGTADVDLLVIYQGDPPRERELIKLSNDIHIDIAYESNTHYAKPRELRGHPWRGWNMWDPTLLHDTSHFFEYTQSSLRAQFDDAVNIASRAHYFVSLARQTWNDFQFGKEWDLTTYLQAVENAANAIASLNGPPLTERRLLIDFPARAQKANKPEYTSMLMACLNAGQLSPDHITAWLPHWQESFETAASHPFEARIHPSRIAYYSQAIASHLSSDFPLAALWPLLPTWSAAADGGHLTISQSNAWQTALNELGLNQKQKEDRLTALDVLLDEIEEKLEQLAP